jgi:dolichyl-phosphate-mannose--protein O-mannosyl transferase
LFVHWTLVGPSGDRQARFFIGTFLALYVGYMVAISRLDRVMYLYHYFLPLLFSFFLLAVVAGEVRRLGPWRVNETGRTAGIFVLGALVLVGFRFYHPLTYAEPLTDDGVRARALFPLWELHCARCPRESILVVYKES